MSLAATNLTIDVLEARIRRDLDERYAFYRMLNATDRVLWRLEALNLAGVKRVSVEGWARMYATLAELPAEARALLADPPSVQELLDGVFAAQDALLALHVPGHEREAGEGEDA